MHIYVDESGSFVCTPYSRVCAIAALAVPSTSRDRLFAEFAQFRREVGGADEELKGSTLTERQIARVVAILLSHDAVLDVCAIDMGMERDALTTSFKHEQADALFEHITPQHKATLVSELRQLHEEMIALPNQLFLQMMLTIKLLHRGLETFINYYAQRQPEELAEFSWRVDAKAADLTAAERLWRTLILPMMHEDSFGLFGWADYTHMERYSVRVPPAHPGGPARLGWDLRAIVRENLHFVDSRAEIGLQLVDIATNALTRALNGRLEELGWRSLGRLLVARREGTINLISMNDDASSPAADYRPPFGPRFLRIQSSARPMLLIPPGYVGP
jgi:hypothetical protein